MTWLFGFISGIAATLTVAVVLSRIVSKNEFQSQHRENMALLREGHEIMRENGESLRIIATTLEAISEHRHEKNRSDRNEV